jgi:hypothetical protein
MYLIFRVAFILLKISNEGNRNTHCQILITKATAKLKRGSFPQSQYSNSPASYFWLTVRQLIIFPIAHERKISFYRDPSLKRTQMFNRAQIGADHVRLDARGHGSSLWFDRADLCEH